MFYSLDRTWGWLEFTYSLDVLTFGNSSFAKLVYKAKVSPPHFLSSSYSNIWTLIFIIFTRQEKRSVKGAKREWHGNLGMDLSYPSSSHLQTPWMNDAVNADYDYWLYASRHEGQKKEEGCGCIQNNDCTRKSRTIRHGMRWKWDKAMEAIMDMLLS